MSVSDTVSWLDIRDEILRRIHERVWAPGDAIPNEADLAIEFDCARTTVSRALRDLAGKGLVVRKRRAGTRVAVNPPAMAMLQIQVLREEIEANGFVYRHAILERTVTRPPSVIRHRLDLPADAPALKVVTLHLADGRPYTHDDRWINIETVPEAAAQDFAALSPNEWLVQNAPYSHGEIAIVSEKATAVEAEHLGCQRDDAILVLERATWRDQASITTTRMAFAPGYRLITRL